jgi:FRG domain
MVVKPMGGFFLSRQTTYGAIDARRSSVVFFLCSETQSVFGRVRSSNMSRDWVEHYGRALSNAAERMATWDGVDIRRHTSLTQITHWEEFQAFAVKFSSDAWFFRGQGDSRWRLRPSLERVTSYPIPKLDTQTKEINGTTEIMQDAFYAEYELSREFKRRAHHYLTDLPLLDDHIEWLALMQHFGVPTRLLDWTRSPYVAAYFAVLDVSDDAPCSVWAVDAVELEREAKALIGIERVEDDREHFFWDKRTFDNNFIEDPLVMVVPVQPFRMNQRLTVQQGVFLCSANLTIGFEDNLGAVIKRSNGAVRLHRLDIAPSARFQFLRELDRMNISHATLFPGLDGFAAYLRNNFRLKYEAKLRISSDA